MHAPPAPPAQTSRALELKTLRVLRAPKHPLTGRPPRRNHPLSRPTCSASWPLSRVGNPRGSRDALDATRRDALDATRTDRVTAHGPVPRIRPRLLLPDRLLLAGWFLGGLSPAVRQRLTSGLSARRGPRLVPGMLTNGPTPYCLCKPYSCKACPGINPSRHRVSRGLRQKRAK